MSETQDLRATLGHLLRKKLEIQKSPGYTSQHPNDLPRIEDQILKTKEAIEKNLARENGETPAQENGRKRENLPFIEPATPRQGEPNEEADDKVGPNSPPLETRFRPGNPGGPGRPKGSTSLRAMIREALFEEQDGKPSKAAKVVQLLFEQIERGNLSALRIAIQQGTPRPKRKA